MDFQHILKTSRLFYRDHGLPSWRAALPKIANIAEPDETRAEVAKCGFDQGFAFPPFALQMVSIQQLIEETARKPSPCSWTINNTGRRSSFPTRGARSLTAKSCRRTDDLGGRAEGPISCSFRQAGTQRLGPHRQANRGVISGQGLARPDRARVFRASAPFRRAAWRSPVSRGSRRRPSQALALAHRLDERQGTAP